MINNYKDPNNRNNIKKNNYYNNFNKSRYYRYNYYNKYPNYPYYYNNFYNQSYYKKNFIRKNNYKKNPYFNTPILFLNESIDNNENYNSIQNIFKNILDINKNSITSKNYKKKPNIDNSKIENAKIENLKNINSKINNSNNETSDKKINTNNINKDNSFLQTPILFIQDTTTEVNENEMNVLPDIFKTLLGINKKNDLNKDEKIIKKNYLKKEYDLNKTYVELNTPITNLNELIKLTDIYDEKNDELMDSYAFNIKRLYNIKEPLLELNELIGMENIKNKILNQILYYLQDIEDINDMLHIAITGSPGIGKTSLGLILAKLYYKLGLLEDKPSINPISGKKEKFNFKIYKRSDLIGQYVGHTAIKTQKAIDECIGGVMFLDEAYSLGHEEKSDTFSKECIDTINQNLSENKNKFILIIAGYESQLEKCFFAQNEGLKRRFAFIYNLDNYSPKELAEILLLKINKNQWSLDNNLNLDYLMKLIEDNKEMFVNFGGDIESWFLNIKITHGIRIFGKHPKLRKIIVEKDLINGLELFKKSKNLDKYISEKKNEEFVKKMMYC